MLGKPLQLGKCIGRVLVPPSDLCPACIHFSPPTEKQSHAPLVLDRGNGTAESRLRWAKSPCASIGAVGRILCNFWRHNSLCMVVIFSYSCIFIYVHIFSTPYINLNLCRHHEMTWNEMMVLLCFIEDVVTYSLNWALAERCPLLGTLPTLRNNSIDARLQCHSANRKEMNPTLANCVFLLCYSVAGFDVALLRNA